MRYNVVDVAGSVRRSLPSPVELCPLIHDCAITERFVAIQDISRLLSLSVVLADHGFPLRSF